MADSSMKVLIELAADARKFTSGMRQGERGLSAFASKAKSTASMVASAFAAMGVTIGAAATAWKSAQLDKSLTQIGQTAGATKKQVQELRSDLFRLGKESGQSLDNLKEGFNVLVQSGLNMKEAKATLDGVNKAMAVTGADAKTLANGLTVAAQAFQFDLEKPGMALELLDKMTVAGRLGNAELENLSDIFARVGVNAASAGMNFNSTLGFVEALSKIERQPERLATLADSTLRVFTNLKYMQEAQKATGVSFFDSKGARRDAVAVIEDIRKKYATLKTDAQRAEFIQSAFGKADLDTIKGLKTLLSGDSLDAVRKFSQEIGNAGGTLKRDMPEATRNLVDQAGRLKAVLLEAADNFVSPINKTLADLLRWGMNSKKEGGAGLSGGQMIGGGLALGAAALLAGKFGGKAIGGFLKGKAGTGLGIAEGKAVQAATGVTPVFVTNWPGGSGLSSLAGSAAGVAGAAATGTAAKTVLGGLAKIAPIAMRLLPMLTSPVGLAVGGTAVAGGLVMLIKNMMQKKDQQKNQVNLSVRVDQQGQVMAVSNDLNTSLDVKLWRGGF